MSMRRARLAPDVAGDHGRYIYAYCHVRTHQVVYSLTQTLKNEASLKQLPDLGANHKDARLRKDLWRPLYTLCLPSASPHALRQGLHAFKKLREYRKLHELNWTPSPLLAKPKTATEIQLMKDKLGDRGGSKKENVYDLIVREKKKMRVKSVMDQKANSIADLAAVLLEQEDLGAETVARKDAERSTDRAAEVKEMLALAAEAEAGALARLEHEVGGLQRRVANLDASEQDEEGLTKRKLKRELFALTSRIARMQFASTAVRAVREGRRTPTPPPPTAAATPSHPRKPSRAADAAAETPTVDSLLTRSRALRARHLRHAAAEARKTGLATLDGKIARLAQRAPTHVGEEDARARLRLLGLRIAREYMALAAESVAGLTEGAEEVDFEAAARGVRVRVGEFKVGLLEGEGGTEAEVEQARRDVEILVRTGLLPGERERAEEEVAASLSAAAGQEGYNGGKEDADAPAPEDEGRSHPPTSATSEPTPALFLANLPPFPPRAAARAPKRGPQKQKLLRLNSPVFSTEGVTVKWQNVMDAEFAASWPGQVAHERMGWVRNTAPRGDRGGVEDVGEWKAGLWGNKGVEGGEREREVRAELVRGVGEGALGRVGGVGVWGAGGGFGGFGGGRRAVV
ncbi:hypothetical protein LTR08_000197 [Meristemomyces frigidus]|nr:hypothetical protein LTR08_000197 [Meristemomyces frigidus]